MGLYDVSMLITHFASIFISSLRILRLFVRASPSQSPQSSITMEWVRPILLGKKKKKKKKKPLNPCYFAISSEATSNSPTRVSTGRPINVELEETHRRSFQPIRLMVC